MFSVFFRDMFFHPLLNMRWRNPNCTFIFPSRFLVSFLLNLQHSQMLSGFADISPGSKILSRVFVSYCWWFRNPANQLIWAISHYLQGFIDPRWLFGISSINSTGRTWAVTSFGLLPGRWPTGTWQMSIRRGSWCVEMAEGENSTPWKINMGPENTPLEDENHLPNHHFSGSMLIFPGCILLQSDRWHATGKGIPHQQFDS